MPIPHVEFHLGKEKKERKIPFLGLATLLKKEFPELPMHLKQAGFKESDTEWIAKSIMFGVVFGVGSFLVLFFFANAFEIKLPLFAMVGIALVLLIQGFFGNMARPQIITKKRMLLINKHLLNVFNTMSIQLSAGASLYRVFKSVAMDDFGELAKMFKKAVKDIDLGKTEIQVLQEMSDNNPSPYFRKAIWEFISALQSGASISDVLDKTAEDLSDEQRNMRKQLEGYIKTLTMMYMMMAVVVPLLVMTLLAITSVFVPTITGFVFGIVLFFQLVINYLFMQTAKKKRQEVI